MAAGFVDYFRMTLGWKSSPAVNEPAASQTDTYIRRALSTIDTGIGRRGMADEYIRRSAPTATDTIGRR